ncbi:MAG TPA: hypothetical protein VGI64_05700 [Streptosporangiaceae bacterium]|jgi:hypothetical protein
MRDVGYVATGYSLTLAGLAGYRYYLARRARKARRFIDALSQRAREGRRRP